ncbi:MAG TPA: hypothetical protein VFF69_11445 [Phycisphaerales bacterium]|nr:hypothetical protein [Phycisphaerales bacterium]
MHPNTRSFVALLALWSGAATPASVGGIIVSTSMGTNGGLTVTSATVGTPEPGNDNVPGLSANTLFYMETYNDVATGAARFAHAEGPPTEYSVTLVVTNETGVVWTDYALFVGLGNIDFPLFVDYFAFDFDMPPTISGAGGLPSWSSPDANWLVWSGLEVEPGSTIQFEFNLDLLAENISGDWLIHQRPTAIPAPATAAVLLASAACLSMSRRTRRSSERSR